MEGKKKLPIGIENFEKIRTEGFYYIDKTAMIKELLAHWGEVNLFTRPRRFGKSLTMSMLKYFFELDCDRTLFDGLAIAGEHGLCEEYMGKFPVISISLKGVDGLTFETARGMLCSIIGLEAMRFHFLLQSERLSEEEKGYYSQLIKAGKAGEDMIVMSDSTLCNSLRVLSSLLWKHFGRKVIILIDEYDVPLDKAQQAGYYDSMVSLIRNLFAQALKTNDSLYLAVLTGCLRISKESIFTGLNNLKVLSIADVRFNEYFGFTEKEVQKLLSYYQLAGYENVIREWYDGYQFGNTEVYCPWDVISYCDALLADPTVQPEAYWINTSGNAIIRRFLDMAESTTTKQEIERLIAGETICKEIRMELTYRDLDQSIENLWSVLYTAGYLTGRKQQGGSAFELKIPNLEIREIFTGQIYSWFQEKAELDGERLNAFCEAFQNGDAQEVERRLNDYLWETISIRDSAVRKGKQENFYHGILLGLLGYKAAWGVTSNKESGEGYSDIMVEIGKERIGIVVEIKYPDSENLEAGCVKALRQIEERKYEDALKSNGMREVIKYGIACRKKHCRVMRG